MIRTDGWVCKYSSKLLSVKWTTSDSSSAHSASFFFSSGGLGLKKQNCKLKYGKYA